MEKLQTICEDVCADNLDEEAYYLSFEENDPGTYLHRSTSHKGWADRPLFKYGRVFKKAHEICKEVLIKGNKHRWHLEPRKPLTKPRDVKVNDVIIAVRSKQFETGKDYIVQGREYVVRGFDTCDGKEYIVINSEIGPVHLVGPENFVKKYL